MANSVEGSPGEVMRRVLATEAAARDAEESARLEASARLERARAEARAIEARAVARVQRMHERAQQAESRRHEAMWEQARERLEALESSAPGDDLLNRAVAILAAWLTRGDDEAATTGKGA